MPKVEAAWSLYLEHAIEPTMKPGVVALFKMAFLSGYLGGLADLGDAAKAQCMPHAWAALIREAASASEVQSAKCAAILAKAETTAKRHAELN